VIIKKRSARVAVASIGLATGVALVGVGAAVAQSGDTPESEHTNQGQSDEDHGLHKGWAKLIENAGNGLHKGWDQHGQHGGAPVTEPGAPSEEPATAPGKSDEPHGKAGEDHGQAGDDHGTAGEKGKGAENGEAGQDHGQAGDDHGKAGERP